MDKEVVSKIDSLNVIFEFKEKGSGFNEFFKFKKNDVNTNLEYFNRQINVGQTVKVKIKAFKGKRFYEIERNVKYMPWTDTVINLI